MMPRLSPKAVRVIKGVMVQRLPDCYFTAEDVDCICGSTGLEPAQISTWAENLRKRVPVYARASYLAANKANPDDSTQDEHATQDDEKIDSNFLDCMCTIL